MELVIKNITDKEIQILEENDFDWSFDDFNMDDAVINGSKEYCNKVKAALGRREEK